MIHVFDYILGIKIDWLVMFKLRQEAPKNPEFTEINLV